MWNESKRNFSQIILCKRDVVFVWNGVGKRDFFLLFNGRDVKGQQRRGPKRRQVSILDDIKKEVVR